jgi:hypothetical protein
MYEELVEEFDRKKREISVQGMRDNKLAFAQQEVSKLRLEDRSKEAHINAFKRDLSNIIGAMLSGKDLQEAIQVLLLLPSFINYRILMNIYHPTDFVQKICQRRNSHDEFDPG